MTAAASSARALAARAVAQVLERRVTLDAAFASTPADDRAHESSARSLAYGAIRGHFRYQAVLSGLLRQPVESIGPLARGVLGVALFELEDAITPQYAIVDAAVETARVLGQAKLSGLINAVLRRYLRERVAIDSRIQAKPSVRYAFPGWMARRIEADWPDRANDIMAQSDRPPPLWLRVNAQRTSMEAYRRLLDDSGIAARVDEKIPFSIVLDAPRPVSEIPGFQQGLVSVQDLGAQCAVFPLALEPGLTLWDACAAPGGKTALALEREPGLAHVLATDVDEARLVRVSEGLARLGLTATVGQADAARESAGERFDRILLDVPCSALGVIRRHPDIRLRRQAGDFAKFAATQAALLRTAWTRLKPGGRLVYASCTVTKRENHVLLTQFLRDTPSARPVPPESWNGWPNLGKPDGIGVQIFPGEAAADGFYYAALTNE